MINILLFVIARLPYDKLLIYKRLLLLLMMNAHSLLILILMMISNERYLITYFIGRVLCCENENENRLMPQKHDAK